MVANAPSKDLAQWLSSQAVVGAYGGQGQWAVHTVVEPDGATQHADVVTLYDTGGGDVETEQFDLATPNIQVRIRCLNYAEGHAKARSIRDALLGTAPIVTAGATFILVALTSDVTHIGQDENQRHLLTANYRTVQQL